eukprot:1182765-Pyramimonas_sp.AAC.1
MRRTTRRRGRVIINAAVTIHRHQHHQHHPPSPSSQLWLKEMDLLVDWSADGTPPVVANRAVAPPDGLDIDRPGEQDPRVGIELEGTDVVGEEIVGGERRPPPPPPCLPPCGRSPLPSWAPHRLELPQPGIVPRYWHFVPFRDVPEVWFIPTWRPSQRMGLHDPSAVLMIFRTPEGEWPVGFPVRASFLFHPLL